MNMQIQIGPNVHMRVTDGTAVDMSPTSHVKTLCNQSFLNNHACSGDESSAKVLFEHPSTTFVYTKT